MSITQAEYESEMKRICDKHTNEVVYLININVLAGNLCHTLGHDFHLMLSECVRCYCKEHNISFDQLKACALDLDQLSATIQTLSHIDDHMPINDQASKFCSQLLNKLR